MSTTDNPDLYSMKLPELRALALEKGLKSITALRKGELIMAIETGKVPRKSTEKPLPRKKKSEMQARQAAELNAHEAIAAAGDVPAGNVTTEQVSVGNEHAGDATSGNEQQHSHDDNDNPSPAAARRARRIRAKARANHNDGGGHNNQKPARRDGAAQSHRTENTTAGAERADQETAAVEAAQTAGVSDHQQDPNGAENQQVEHRKSGDGNSRRGRRGRRVRRLTENNQNRNNDIPSDDRDDHDERGDRAERGNRHRDSNRDNNNDGNRSNHGDNNRDNRDNRGDDSRNQDDRNNENRNNDRNNGLQEVAGILEVVDGNAAFLRTTGYRPSSLDVFVNTNLVRRFHLRTGDYLTGKVKMTGGGQSHGKGRNRKKYNQMVFVETVNGLHPEEAKQRPQFSKLTPLYPNKRLRLETDPKILTTRVIDLIMPIGKGQRALIVSPPKAGKTTILQNIANAISTNNPECYLMVVLVDERPEEVTDMQRSVNGEVIASTFDRPPSEHTAVAELAIERAKRLVEQGQDVVVLLDSITRLGRAYNNSSPASGRILSGGVDSNALYPPKRFLGAARNIENGGSLTIIATAMVETGSTGDTVIFEEFKGTGNAELKLDRGISERRVFPAVDVNPSGTRKDELLLVPEEARIMTKLRRILSALDSHQAIDLLIKQLRKTKSNGEFLMQVASSAPMAAALEEEE